MLNALIMFACCCVANTLNAGQLTETISRSHVCVCVRARLAEPTKDGSTKTKQKKKRTRKNDESSANEKKLWIIL